MEGRGDTLERGMEFNVTLYEDEKWFARALTILGKAQSHSIVLIGALQGCRAALKQ